MKATRKDYLFVDGYNIINCWNNLREISKVSLEEARNELIDVMAEYKGYTGTEVVVVFDAHLVKGSCHKKETIKGIEVVYTKENETADHYIEKKLDIMGKTKSVKVATSDWIEQQVVMGRGGTRISARELKLEIESLKNMISRKSKKNNEINDLIIGRLDKSILEKLRGWGESK